MTKITEAGRQLAADPVTGKKPRFTRLPTTPKGADQ